MFSKTSFLSGVNAVAATVLVLTLAHTAPAGAQPTFFSDDLTGGSLPTESLRSRWHEGCR